MILNEDFLKQTKEILGDDFPLFRESLKDVVPTSIRINNKKIKYTNNHKYRDIEWCNNAYYLPQRPPFTFDPLLHAGCYYVQEASSMFIYQFLNQYVKSKDLKILDLCAAPGGKSTLIADYISSDSILISNEVIRSRANILTENIIKCGQPNVIVTNNDPSDFKQLKNFFDIVFVDAPCSGEGMFRKDIKAINEWSIKNVTLCKERQRRIVANIWDSLKPGGFLVYSTCTFNREENENNIDWICTNLGGFTVPLDVVDNWNITEYKKNNYHFFPHKTIGEGFFLSVIKKNENSDNQYLDSYKNTKKGKKKHIVTKELEISYKSYIKNHLLFDFYEKDNMYIALTKKISEIIPMIKEQKLKIIHMGICIGEYKGKSFVPNQSLAMSNILDSSQFTTYDVDYNTAIKYLRKENINIDTTHLGFILITYFNLPLGFVKNIGNRVNNLYPQEWVIRSSQLPDNSVDIIL